MNENPKPIKDYHVAFARAVVALARQHGVGGVRMTFRRASSKIFNTEEKWDSNEVSVAWHEGRHGSTDEIKIVMEARASLHISECEHNWLEFQKVSFGYAIERCSLCGASRNAPSPSTEKP